MKMERNGTVIILGAGFSKTLAEIVHQQMPLMKDFILIAYNLDHNPNGPYRNLWKFIELFWDIEFSKYRDEEDILKKYPDIEKRLKEVNIEDLLSIIKERNEEGKITVDKETFSSHQLEMECLDMIYELLAHRIRHTLIGVPQLHGTNRVGSGPPPISLLKIVSMPLWNWIEKIKDLVGIISFNWDYIVDDILLNIAQNEGQSIALRIYDADFIYGFIPKAVYRPGSHPWWEPRRGDDMTAFKLLKLHGSLNWLICNECKDVYIYEAWDPVHVSQNREISCPRCGAEFIPGIIPPMTQKAVSSFPYSAIWRKAFQVLSEVQNVIVVGFSLREADFQAKHLFQHAVANNPNKQKFSLTIVDPEKNVVDRFESIWQMKSQYFSDFKDYLKKQFNISLAENKI